MKVYLSQDLVLPALPDNVRPGTDFSFCACLRAGREVFMARWLYRYVFRGIGIVFLIGLLTILFLQIRYVIFLSRQAPAGTAGHSDRR